MTSIFLRGAPISFVLFFLFVYAVGVLFYFFTFFREKLSKKILTGIILPLVPLRLEEIDVLTQESIYSIAPEIYKIQKHLQFLKLIVNLAPLLGLLGTVFGLIKSTGGLATQDQNALLLGISQSLITTSMGLLVSIPALLVHFFGKAKEDKLFITVKEELIRRGKL